MKSQMKAIILCWLFLCDLRFVEPFLSKPAAPWEITDTGICGV